MQNKHSIVFIGATGAVGSACLKQLLTDENTSRILTLGRRTIDFRETPGQLHQAIIDIHDPSSYADLIVDYDIAICTLGVGKPSKISKADFIAIDKIAVLHFAKICKEKGVRHFHLLSSVGTSNTSRNYYLRTKGELHNELIKLNFDSLSIYQPSMILTPQNRYGWTQAIFLTIWPMLDFIFQKGLRKYRGIKVDMLGKAIANNVSLERHCVEYLQYDDFLRLQA